MSSPATSSTLPAYTKTVGFGQKQVITTETYKIPRKQNKSENKVPSKINPLLRNEESGILKSRVKIVNPDMALPGTSVDGGVFRLES